MARGSHGRNAPGYVDGVHFTKKVEEVERLAREGQDADALTLLTRLMDATEAESRTSGIPGDYPAPWYYEKAAILLRRGKRFAEEVAVLTRYREVSGRDKFDGRLRKASELLAKQEGEPR